MPVLVPIGEDKDDDQQLAPNPRPAWSMETMQLIKEGRMKRVRFWTQVRWKTASNSNPE